MHNEGLMHDWLFALCLTLLNILFALYIVRPRRSTLRRIYWVCNLIFISLYPLALLEYHLDAPPSPGIGLGLAFMITFSFSGVLFASACWVWVIRHSFLK